MGVVPDRPMSIDNYYLWVADRETLHLRIDELRHEGVLLDSDGVRDDIVELLSPHLSRNGDILTLGTLPDSLANKDDPNLQPGLELVKAILALKTYRSHWFKAEPMSDEEYDHENRAFGEAPSLQARGLFIKRYGMAKYRERMGAWGANDKSLSPGVAPGSKTAERKKPVDSTNPFLNLRDKDGKINPVFAAKVHDIISHLGTAKASAMAKSAGVTIDGRQLR